MNPKEIYVGHSSYITLWKQQIEFPNKGKKSFGFRKLSWIGKWGHNCYNTPQLYDVSSEAWETYPQFGGNMETTSLYC